MPDHDFPIQVRALHRRYGVTRHHPGFEAVRGVDLRVGRGELVALLGTNGAGKTSTMEVIEGLAPASAGTVALLGLDPYRDRSLVRPQIGIMLQEAGFPGALTVREMAEVWRRTLENPRAVGEVLELVVLGHRADVAISALSGGERRRLDLALALMGRPEVLFLDEPTTGLDPQSRRATWQLIGQLVDQQTTVLLTTHYLEEAEALADRIAIMHAGVIATEGTLTDLVARQPAQISFTAPAGLRLDGLARAAGAGFHSEPAHGTGQPVRIETFASQAMLATVLAWAGDTVLDGLRVQPGSLERTFLDIAAQPLGSPSPRHEEVPA